MISSVLCGELPVLGNMCLCSLRLRNFSIACCHMTEISEVLFCFDWANSACYIDVDSFEGSAAPLPYVMQHISVNTIHFHTLALGTLFRCISPGNV